MDVSQQQSNPKKVVRTIHAVVNIHEEVKRSKSRLRVAAYCRVSTNVDAFDDGEAKTLMDEKAKLQLQLDMIADMKQKRENAKSRLDEIFTIIEALANHPMDYDDRIIRQILESVIVE